MCCKVRRIKLCGHLSRFCSLSFVIGLIVFMLKNKIHIKNKIKYRVNHVSHTKFWVIRHNFKHNCSKSLSKLTQINFTWSTTLYVRLELKTRIWRVSLGILFFIMKTIGRMTKRTKRQRSLQNNKAVKYLNKKYAAIKN